MRLALTIFLFLCHTTTAAEPLSLHGVWQVTSTHYDDEAIGVQEPRQIKVFTDHRVFYTYYEKGFEERPPRLSVGHGSYSFADGTLTETIENHSNPTLIGQTFKVSVSIGDGGKSFTQTVDLGKYVLRETWTRLE